MKKPIRILHYIGSLEIGGSQTMIMNLYRNIDRNMIQFDFVIDKKDNLFFKDEIIRLGGKIFMLEPYKGSNHFSFKKQWDIFFKNHPEYKIIHSHVRSTASIVLKIAKNNGLITISHSHSTSNGKGIKALVKKIFQYKIRFVADYFMACSKDSARWLFGSKKANSHECVILNNSIDSQAFAYNKGIREMVRKKFNISNKTVIGQVGRFINTKNYKFSIELFYKYLSIDSSAFLLLIGDGPLLNDIKTTIANLKIEDKVLILSNRNDINELMQAIDVFLMPSLYEGLPLTLVEAQAASLPCLISDKITAGKLIDDLIFEMSLSDQNEWINKINFCKDNVKKNRSSEIVKYGFDVVQNSKILVDFYYKLLSKEKS